MVCQVLKECLHLRMVPDLEQEFDMTPVDYVSEAIIRLSRRRENLRGIYHLVNPDRVSFRQLADGLEGAGYRIRRVTFEEWRDALEQLAREEPGNDYMTTLTLFGRWVENQMEGREEPRFDCSRTLAALGEEPQCPRVDVAVLQNYVSHLAETGYLRLASEIR